MNRSFPAEGALLAYLGIASISILILTPPNWLWLLLGHLAAVLLVRRLCHHPGASDSTLGRLRGVAPLVLFGPLYWITGRINLGTSRWILDGPVERLEETIFGEQPSLVLADRLPWLWLSEIVHAGYFLYFVLVAALPLALYLQRRTEALVEVTAVLCSCFFVCLACYIYLPVTSPLYAYPGIGPPLSDGFFFRLTHSIAESGGVVGGAFPSSHAALSSLSLLLAFRFEKRLFWWMVMPTIALLIGTVYGRYHFALDTIAGVLLAVIVFLLARRRDGRVLILPETTEGRTLLRRADMRGTETADSKSHESPTVECTASFHRGSPMSDPVNRPSSNTDLMQMRSLDPAAAGGVRRWPTITLTRPGVGE